MVVDALKVQVSSGQFEVNRATGATLSTSLPGATTTEKLMLRETAAVVVAERAASVPATAGIMFVLWSPFSRLFTAASLRLSGIWNSVNVGVEATGSLASKETAATDSASYLSPEKTAEYGLWVFGILLGFFLLIYISKAIEWAILQAKL